MNTGPLAKVLILTGAAIIILGVLLLFIDKIPLLGKLPGDIMIRKKNFALYIPLGTMILLSVGLSLILYIISYFRK
ncbi:MAG: DUF2905 domain-containing protein [Candidatus Zixiibacteriota bacterium]|nr:MAG: DUF2905 domain-containing protein [candidate division Zixibacteria bacterium]